MDADMWTLTKNGTQIVVRNPRKLEKYKRLGWREVGDVGSTGPDLTPPKLSHDKPVVLHVVSRFTIDGASRILRTCASRLDYAFVAVCSIENDRTPDTSMYADARVLGIPLDGGFGKAVGEYANAIGASLIHCGVLPGAVLMAMRRATDIPIIGGVFNEANCSAVKSLNVFDGCITDSRIVADTLPATFIGSCADEMRFAPQKAGSYTVGLLCRWSVEKRVDRFVGLAKLVHETIPSVRFFWIGGANHDGAAQSESDIIRSADGHIAVTGITPRPEDWLASCDVTVITSDIEGGPTSLWESLLCGVPVISLPVGCAEDASESHSVTVVDDIEGMAAEICRRAGRVRARRRKVDQGLDEYTAGHAVNVIDGIYKSHVMTDGPVVSVVMPAYNAAKYLPDAIASMQAQTYRNWELCVALDGPDAEMEAILSDVGDERVKWSVGSRGGYARTFNAALAMCTGEYIARLDADDSHSPLRLQKQVGYLQRHGDIDCVSTEWHVMLKDGRLGGATARGKFTPEMYGAGNLDGGTCNASIMARRSAYDRVGEFDPEYEWSADSNWNLRAIKARLKWGIVPEPMYYYRQHQEQMSKIDPAAQTATWRKGLQEIMGVCV